MNLSISKVMAVLGAAYPGFNFSAETIAIYERCLVDIPPEILNAAVAKCVTEKKFFPTVSELREAAFALMTQQHTLPTEFEAWEEVQKEISRCGDYYRYDIGTKNPQWSHPLIEKTVDAIGYKTLLNSENEVADRAHFFQAYRALRMRAENDVKMLPEVRQASENYEAPALMPGIRLLTNRLSVKG